MWNSKLLAAPNETFWSQVTWFFCMVYAMAALLRLARFNVENEHGEKAHTDFTGLPAPGAGGLVASLVIFYHYLSPPATNEIVAAIYSTFGQENVVSFLGLLRIVMPLLMIILAFLMVSSRIHYVHVLNKLFREKRTFDYFTYLIFAFILVALVPQLALPFVFAIYVAIGPIQYAARYFREKASAENMASEDSIAR
jgi:phosphatidylserine synthase